MALTGTGLTWDKILTDIEPFHGVILYAFIDPVVVAIGLWMGWHADQKGKLILAGLLAGLAGTVTGFVADLLGLGWFEGGFLFGGAHAFFRVLAGYLWAIAGYAARRFKS